ncbi:short-chain dehydrogenase/reductase SDR, partial [mine drainage metagenome]
MISGATGGIGFEIASGLAREGYSLALIGRSEERLAAARAALGIHLPRVEVRLFRADLSELRATDQVASSIAESLDRIDALVNNAGGIFAPFHRTTEGIERTWALNVLSPFLLTERLLPRLAASGAGRVVNISSAAHGTGRLRWDDLQRQGAYSAWG